MKFSSKHPFLTAYVGFIAHLALLYVGIMLASMVFAVFEFADSFVPALRCVLALAFPIGGFFAFRRVVRLHLLPGQQLPQDSSQ